jgi:hypothetical protein
MTTDQGVMGMAIVGEQAGGDGQGQPDDGAGNAAGEGDDDRLGEKLQLDLALVAPRALRMPISRTRARTPASMMFMMPTPPTARVTKDTATSSRVRRS